MRRRLMPKPIWKLSVGVARKVRNLKLLPQVDGVYVCPVDSCDSQRYRSQRGCRKHVYFDITPDAEKVLPEFNTRMNQGYYKAKLAL